ncbi:MAG: Spy/CpxP family protein refolding chaperone [Planctomycetota bacterium]
MHTQNTNQPYWTLTLAVAAAGLLAVGPALAAPSNTSGESKGDRPQRSAESSERGQRGGPGGERARGRDTIRLLFRDIQLSDSQREDIREVMAQARDERRAWMEENGDEIRELRERMQDASAIRDTDAMQSIGQDLRAIMSAGPQPMAVAEEVRGMLTEDQVEQFDANVVEVEERMAQRRAQGRQNASPGGERGERGQRGEAGSRGERGEAGSRGERGEAGERGPRGEGRGGPEGRNGRGGPEGRNGAGGPEGQNGQARDGEGIDREAIERRLREFRERREAQRTAPPVMGDDDFTDEPAEPDSGDADTDGDQLQL